jgi:hypothetical protein
MSRSPRHPSLVPHTLLAALLAASTLGGCLQPRDAAPVAQAGLVRATALAVAYERDLRTLRAATAALLAIDRERVRLAAESSILAHCLAAGESDHSGAVGDACAIAQSINAGAMSRDDARTWLRDYTEALDADNAHVLDSLVARLTPLRDHDDASAAVLAAIDDHAAYTARLATDAAASASMLVEFTSFDALQGEAARAHAEAILDAALLDRIQDADRRAAAERLLARVLDLAAPEHDQR